MKLIKEKGITIVEIVVALGLLGIVSVGAINFFTDSFKFQARSQESSRAQKVAEEIFEELNDTKQYNGIKLVDLNKGYDKPIFVEGDYTGRLTVNNKTSSSDKVDAAIVGWTYDITVTVTSQGQNKMTGRVNSTIEVEGTLGDEGRDFLTIKYILPIYAGWIYPNPYLVKYDIGRDEGVELLSAKPISTTLTAQRFAGWSSELDQFSKIEEISKNDLKEEIKTVYAFWYCECCGNNEYFIKNSCSCIEDWCVDCGSCTKHCKLCPGNCGEKQCEYVQCSDGHYVCKECDMCEGDCGYCEYHCGWCDNCYEPSCKVDMCNGNCGYCEVCCENNNGWCYDCNKPGCKVGMCNGNCGYCEYHCGWCDECQGPNCECATCVACGDKACRCCDVCGTHPCSCGQGGNEVESEGTTGGAGISGDIGNGAIECVCDACKMPGLVEKAYYCEDCVAVYAYGCTYGGCVNCCKGEICVCCGKTYYCLQMRIQGMCPNCESGIIMPCGHCLDCFNKGCGH